LTLEPGVFRGVSLTVGDNLEQQPGTGAPAAALILELEGVVQKGGIEVRLNGTAFEVTEPATVDVDKATSRLGISVGAPELRQGENLVEVSLRAEGRTPSGPVVLSRLLLRVNPGPSQ
jgi:hypothetical protein